MSKHPKSIPLTPEMLHFLRCQSVSCKKSTLGTYQVALRHLAQSIQDRRIILAKLTPADLSNFLYDLNQHKLAPYTKLHYFISVRKYLAWEVEQQRLPLHILSSFDRNKLPKVPEYLPKPLTTEIDQEFQRRCRHSKHPYALLFLLLRQTGLRISELINLPWDPIVTSHDAPFLKVPLGKMNTERMIPLQKESIDLIKKIQSAYPIRLNRCDKRRLIGLKGPISSVRSHLDLHFKKLTAGLHDQNKPITFHRLRHTYATTLLSAGLSIVSIMKLLGHRRIEMSLRYTKVTPAHLRNEYLKAIASIESQTGLQTQIPSTRATYHPSEVVEQLRSFVYKAAKISAPQKKNLLRYLARLKKNLHEISFNGHFKFTQ